MKTFIHNQHFFDHTFSTRAIFNLMFVVFISFYIRLRFISNRFQQVPRPPHNYELSQFFMVNRDYKEKKNPNSLRCAKQNGGKSESRSTRGERKTK